MSGGVGVLCLSVQNFKQYGNETDIVANRLVLVLVRVEKPGGVREAIFSWGRESKFQGLEGVTCVLVLIVRNNVEKK